MTEYLLVLAASLLSRHTTTSTTASREAVLRTGTPILQQIHLLLTHRQHSSPEEGGDGGGQGGDLWREGEVAVAPASAVVHATPAPTIPVTDCDSAGPLDDDSGSYSKSETAECLIL